MNKINMMTTLGKIKDAKHRQDLAELESFKENKAFEDELEKRSALVESAMEATKTRREFFKWKNDVKEALLSEAIMSIFNDSFNKIYSEDSKFENLKQSLVHGFINESGVDNTIEHFKYASDMLAQYAEVIEEAYHEMTDKATPDCCMIDTSAKDRFYDKLANADKANVTKQICGRVQDAVETFVTRNAANRQEIKDVLQATQDKIVAQQQKNSTDVTTDQTPEEVAESFSQIANMKIRKIENTPVNLFDEMAYNACKNLYKIPEKERKDFTLENGKLDMETVMESCKVIYTFMEMLNTTRMHNFKPEELQDFVENVYKY